LPRSKVTLNNDHIDYIIKDLQYRGVILENFQDEVIDHVCSAVEKEMETGKRFIDAYTMVIKSFGYTEGLQKTQKETLHSENPTPRIMIRNYLKIALRNLSRQRFYSFINISGLALGVAACLLIVLYVTHELSYDQYHAKADRIYRVNGEIKFAGNHYQLACAPAPLGEALVNEFPEIETAVRFRSRGTYLVKRENATESFREDKVIWTDSSFFKIFSVPVLQGNANTALKEPNTIAISRSAAEKYFKNEIALGQTLMMDNRWPFKVTAVFEDMPTTGHFKFDFMMSLAGLDEAKSVNFLSNNFNTYILLRKNADAKALEAKFPQMVVKYVGPQAAQLLGGEFTMEKFIAGGNKLEYTLMPISDIHLHSDLTAELGPNSDITYVYLFSAVAVFILFIACINFMNLSTARSANRAKEVGVRKVMGSMRSHLVRQFLTESILVTMFAFVLAIGLAYLALPFFNMLSQLDLSLPINSINFYLVILVAALAVGLLSGLYPSFFLSAFQPVKVLKGQLALGSKSGVVRGALVVFQFCISIFLIIGTFTVQSQLNYIQNKKVGFNKDQVIMINDAYSLADNKQAFKNEVLKNNFISSGTISGYIPVSGGWRNDNTHWPEGSSPTQENMVGMQCWYVDHDYLKTMGMNIIQGRAFSQDYPSDSTAVILNQTAVQHFRLGNDPIGKKIATFAGQNADGTIDQNKHVFFTVIGVVEDFHFESLKQNIDPLGFFIGDSPGYASFRFEAKNTQDVITAIEASWKKLAPGQPFQYSFLDESFGRMYASEQRLGKIFAGFAGLAIIIACLGLFALTAFTAEQRTKEIGIRKVLGASVASIIVLLSKEFGKLILIAFVISVPLAWFAVDWWLKNYTYKVEVGVFVYATAGFFAFIVAWLTMGYQSIKAASSNPVNSLRNE
jgi:putative ABC transport system permease protein